MNWASSSTHPWRVRLLRQNMSLIDVDTNVNEYRFERRMQSIEESKSLIEFVDRALNKLKRYPDNGDLYFHLIRKLYVNNHSFKLDEEDLLEELHISRSTFYREKKKAITLFGVTLWGFALNGILNQTKM
jgi:AraC-like DNA-binding protein